MSDRTVYIIDDDPGVRDALAMLMQSVGLDVRTFISADDFLADIPRHSIACMIVDVCMPGTNGVAFQKILIDKKLQIPLIAISAHGDIPMAVEMVKNGALDFFEKPFRNHLVLDRVREALELAERWDLEHRHRQTIAERLDTLTCRESEVLYELMKGSPNKVVARNLMLSPRTVETHRANILRKMHLDSVTELVVALGDIEVLNNAEY